jgi:hypothetical protein
MPITGIGETNEPRDEIKMQPVRYEGARVGQAEGLGLLQDEARPEVRQKEVKRKEIPRKFVGGDDNMSGRRGVCHANP